MENNFYFRSGKGIYLKKWSTRGERTKLEYEDGTVFFVKTTDFNRATGRILCATKEEILQNFAIRAGRR